MGKLNEDDESSETQVFSDCFAEETEQVRQAILSDMVKLACFDGAFDDAEMEFINKVAAIIMYGIRVNAMDSPATV